jgi:hypothetical protein
MTYGFDEPLHVDLLLYRLMSQHATRHLLEPTSPSCYPNSNPKSRSQFLQFTAAGPPGTRPPAQQPAPEFRGVRQPNSPASLQRRRTSDIDDPHGAMSAGLVGRRGLSRLTPEMTGETPGLGRDRRVPQLFSSFRVEGGGFGEDLDAGRTLLRCENYWCSGGGILY